jgi:hypothetical protein
MLLRLPIAVLALTAALPAGAAFAHTDAQVAGGFGQPADPATLTAADANQTTDDGDGLGTAAIIAVAGGTLLVGAAAGAGGARLVDRRHPARA